jgi:hypothetical protein
MPGAIPLYIEGGIGDIDVAHDLREVSLRDFKQKVIGVAHQTICMNHSIVSYSSGFKIFRKSFSVFPAFKNVFIPP